MQPRLNPNVLTRLPKTCTECRRRKQRCLPSPPPSTQCDKCAKRWPPVQCVFREPKQPSRPEHPSTKSIVVFSANDGDPSPWSQPSPASDGAHALSRAAVGSPRTVGGILSVLGSCQSSIPVQNTPRNTELFYFFLEYVAPSVVSIDGAGLPVAFSAVMLPWMLQSPLFPHIAVLMASVTQALELGRQPNKTVEPLILKSKALTVVNTALSIGHDLSDLLRCACNLIIIEWHWGDDDSMWTHMRGIRDLIRSRGGFGALNDPMFVAVALLIDYSLANCFETELLIQNRESAQHLLPPVPSEYHPSLINPLYPHNFRFSDLTTTLPLPPEAASILTDVHRLTLLIINSAPENQPAASPPPDPPATSATIRTAANAMHKCLVLASPPPSPNDSSSNSSEADEDALLTGTLRLAALFYTLAIATLTPLSHLKTSPSHTIMGQPASELADNLYASIRAVPSSRWKRIPGVFLWVMLVAAAQQTTTCADNGIGGREWESPRQMERKFLRRRMATAAQAVSQEEFGLGILCMRGFWLVERWIGERGWAAGGEGSPEWGSQGRGWEEEESSPEGGERELVRR